MATNEDALFDSLFLPPLVRFQLPARAERESEIERESCANNIAVRRVVSRDRKARYNSEMEDRLISDIGDT